ncbi:MAG: ABC transporter ATP-binding protein [Desulfuromonadales bacterium]|nr:ABC transporter ATP-binding protein [Desulfuromonadales bacterium]NIS42183.1 ABC transporter ATP-binding protein [Desulfuromonadales bacterium]
MDGMQNPALEINQLKKSYNRTAAVKGISFAIAPGEIFGLLGPNGAGKSTTINMISGVTRIDDGSVSIFGYDNQTDYRMTRCLSGVMHQEIVIDNFFTIDKALRIHAGYYGVKDDPAWREMLIERLGLGDHLHKVMLKLSGGLKRRFMIAKALIHKPKLLILDEPTAGVDVELRLTLWDFVREINNQGTTVLLTTHYLEEAEQMCERIAIMNHGELVALDTTDQLLQRLGGKLVSISLEHPLEKIPAELEGFNPLLKADGRQLDICLAPEETAMALLERMSGIGLKALDVETRKSNLEDVFLGLTGKSANGNNANKESTHAD